MRNIYSWLLFFYVLMTVPQAFAQKVIQWRGPDRDGIYRESKLLKIWPEKGPVMVFSYEGLGAGHGSVAISKDKLFVLGMPDSTGVLYAFDFKGKLLWKEKYGLEWYENYTGPRSTPTIVDNLLYFESGQGVVYCYNSDTGKKIWSLDLLKQFDAKNIQWGMTESILIEGDRLFCTPGGKDNNMVCLNRLTGETIWSSTGNRQPAAYCSPIYIKHNKTALIVTMTAESVIGVNANTGQFYWQVPQFQGNKIHANSPVYSNGIIYCSSDNAKTNCGLVALKLSDDGKSVTTLWRNENYKNLMGGIILNDGYIYGTSYKKNLWSCVDVSNGRILYTFDKLAPGNMIMADGLFYCYTEKGEVALVKASPTSFEIISSFQISLGTDQHWSHPVIHKGILYIRHGNAFMAYRIKDKT